MNINEALRRYRADGFTDDDVNRCTGLSVRAWREVIKRGAVRTITEKRGRGRVRMCDATTFKRAALIAVLNQAGLSLAMAGQIAYLLPFDMLLYDVCDPIFILLDVTASVDPETGLLPKLKTPKTDWFDPDKPAIADPKDDWLIEIYDGRFVAIIDPPKQEPMIYGDLRKEMTKFVTWFPFHRYIGSGTDTTLVAKWQARLRWADQLDPRFLDYRYEDHSSDDDPLCIAAEAAARGPLFKTTINITLAIRLALRRYLGIDPVISDSEIGESR
jgi:hypothetical protein